MAVSSINSGQFSCREINNRFPSSFNFAQRLTELSSKVSSLSERISPQLKPTVQINSLAIPPYQYGSASYSMHWKYPFVRFITLISVIDLPAYFLFKSEDIPSHFQIQDFNDPHLNDEQYLRSFAEWMNSVIQRTPGERNKDFSMPKDFNDFMNLRYSLIFLRNSSLFEKMKEYIISHEICHGIDKNQSLFRVKGTKTFQEVLQLSGRLLCGVGAIYSFLSPSAGLSLVRDGVILVIATIALSRFGNSKNCEIEKKCDLGAFDILKDVSGAIYFFESMRQINLLEKTKNPSFPADEKGNDINNVKHPSLTSRISYCQEWQTEYLANATHSED